MIGRTEERNKLESLLTEEESQFIAVFGRRRIGKTYLVRETFNYNFTFEHTGLSNVGIKKQSQLKNQLDNFRSSLIKYGFAKDRKINSWNEAFDGLKEIIINSKEEKKVIFIDELSWMDTRDSGLISALEGFWNGFVSARKEKDVILIICASATYWIIDNIVNSKGGLHNRLTGQIHLKPFTLKECEDFLKNKNIIFSREQIVEAYMILGGVPFYWTLLSKGKSLAQNIDALFFKENALLENEYDNLYGALFNKPDQYIKIIEALCLSNKGKTRQEISEITKIASSGNLTKKLIELENCGFIRKYIPFGYKQNNAYYQIIDNYTLFYHKFLKDKRNINSFWQNQYNNPKLNSYRGITFEKVCLEHIEQIKNALGISGIYTEVNSWQVTKDIQKGIFGSQIDLLIIRSDKVINLCEIKYSDNIFTIDSALENDIRRRISDFVNVTKTKYAISPILITTYGLNENEHSGIIQKTVTMDDLFKL